MVRRPPPTSGSSTAALRDFLATQDLRGICAEAKVSPLDTSRLEEQRAVICYALTDYIVRQRAELSRSGPGAIAEWASDVFLVTNKLLVAIGARAVKEGIERRAKKPIAEGKSRAKNTHSANRISQLEARNALRTAIPDTKTESCDWRTIRRLLFESSREDYEAIRKSSRVLAVGNVLKLADAILARMVPELTFVALLSDRLREEQEAQKRHGGSTADRDRRELTTRLLKVYSDITGKRASGSNPSGPGVRWLAALFKKLRQTGEAELAALPKPLTTIARWIREAQSAELEKDTI